MTLTNGQKMALFLLLSSRSPLRFELEGQGVGGVVTPFPDATAFAAALRTALTNLQIGISASDIAAITDLHPMVAGLFRKRRHKAGVPDKQIGNVSTDHNEIIVAVGLDSLYLPDNPCPDGARQITVAKAVAALTL